MPRRGMTIAQLLQTSFAALRARCFAASSRASLLSPGTSPGPRGAGAPPALPRQIQKFAAVALNAPSLTLALSLALGLAGCPQEETRQKPPGGTTTVPPGTTTTASTGGGGAGGGGAGGGGAGGGGAGGGGSGGSTPCGDGVIDPGEDCDGAALGEATCQTLGYPGGTLACSNTCSYFIGDCTGADACHDGIDNDSDGVLDCDEPDCVAACADPCFAPVPIVDPGDVIGATALHADVFSPSCTMESGGEIVHVFTATQATGMLDVTLAEGETGTFSLSLRNSCSPLAPELACTVAYASFQEPVKKLSVPITIGQTVFIVVDDIGDGVSGTFTLSAQSRPIQCGDGIQDPPESCDDGNTTSGDGCSAACAVESKEAEPNDTIAQANAFSAPWYAQISPEGDVDHVQIDLPQTASLTVTVTGLGQTACFDGSMDSLVAILNAAGDVLAINDEGGAGLGSCSKAVAPTLPAGTYYARVSSTARVTPASGTFPYKLTVETFVCGDGTQSPGEECDDGNAVAGDGCTACKLDVDETEPNDTVAQANVYTSPVIARIDPDGDVDVFSVTVPAGAKITAVTTDPTGQGACFLGTDTYVEILGPNGAVLAVNDDAGSYCSVVTAENLAAGKHYVRVQAPPILGMSIVYVFPYALTINVQ